MLAQAMSALPSVLPSKVDYVLREQDQPIKTRATTATAIISVLVMATAVSRAFSYTPSGFAVDRASDWLATAAAPVSSEHLKRAPTNNY